MSIDTNKAKGVNMEYSKILAKEFNLAENNVKNVITLIDEGNTLPFIARYRKEMTGSIDDQVLRELSDRLTYLRNLDERKAEIIKSITEQNKMTDELQKSIDGAVTMTEVEDIYRPFKQKKTTRAGVAIAKGLSPLADMVMSRFKGDITLEANKFVDAEKGVNNQEEALQGAMDIVAERISDDADLRKKLREYFAENAVIHTFEIPSEDKTYDMYYDYSERAKNMPGHRILAINRGENEKKLNVKVEVDQDAVLDIIEQKYLDISSTTARLVQLSIEDGYKRLLFPSLERELLKSLFERASEVAIHTFERNLKPLLLQPPLHNKIILALDPAYRTGCKVAIINENGNVLTKGVVYPTPPQNKTEEAEKLLLSAIARFKVSVIAIGNGTASKETEIFVSNLIKKCPTPLEYAIVNEAGASVYSASKLGAEEFPEYDVSIRSAISIARRLQDPLAELIKIDVKSIGVGEYQHDMPEKRLTEVLSGVVEDCVNKVGVDLNTASVSLLSYVSGLSKATAGKIVEYREKKSFETREELLKVPKLGPKTYQQCAGFLRIRNGKNILDNTGVHPETYEQVAKLLTLLGYTDSDVKNGLTDIEQRVKNYGVKRIVDELGLGAYTLEDAVQELAKPGRDIRDTLPKPVLRKDLLSIEDLKEGMILDGTVRNVVDFGVFVDIGVHQDGLVHISQLSDKFVSSAFEVVKVGDHVQVRVIGVDLQKKKISLSMRNETASAQPKPKPKKEQKKNEPFNDSLKNLLDKFGKK